MNDLYLGDCREVRSVLAGNSVDTIITDPPYGLEFMGKGWDKGVPGVEFWREFLAVAKPGAMLLAFGGTRTFHRMACAIEDAGWEIRDCMMWLYGSGFPKSLDISKAIDKAKGAERGIIGRDEMRYARLKNQVDGSVSTGEQWEHGPRNVDITAPATDLAKRWSGWGTALKPAWEPIIVAMKPLDGTFAENAERWGVAGINVDGGRVGTGDDRTKGGDSGSSAIWSEDQARIGRPTGGRWPANILLDEPAAAMLDAQTGAAVSRFFKTLQESDVEWLDRNLVPRIASSAESHISLQNESVVSALKLAVTKGLPEGSRLSVSTLPSTPVTPKELRQIAMSSIEAIPYFARKFSRESLLESATLKIGPVKVVAAREQTGTTTITVSHWRLDGSADPAIFSTTLPLADHGEAASRFSYCAKASKSERNAGCEDLGGNRHCTVKPLALMEYLCTLTKTPTGGIVLDPFSGSGTTLLAAKNTGREYIGIEQNAEYFEIIKARLGVAQ